MNNRNENLKSEYQQLRMQNVSQKDALKYLAEEYEMNENTLRGIVGRKVEATPIESQYPLNEIAAFGTSTLYDGDGNVRLTWVKRKKQDELQQAEEWIRELANDLPRIPATTPKTTDFRKDVIAVYPMGDPHFGMFAWGEEAGQDFDLKIAERDLCAAVDRLVETVPSCEQALIINLGDFFHADNQAGTTTKGTGLDTDTRWAKVLRVGIKAIRQCIESALRKHRHVSVINVIGNHDTHSAMFLSTALANIYENESRVTIIDNPTFRHYFRFGKNLFGATHGNTVKMQDLPLQMALDRPKDWAETEYRFIFTGHVHHDQRKEIGGVIVESYRTLAAKDAWHTAMGYQAGRDMKSVLFHKDYGEIERHTVSVAMLGA
jgi:predicted phosphodiesterase